MANDARERLLELLRSRSFERKRVLLASGKESDFFIDCKETVLTAEGHALAGEVLLEALAAFAPCDAVAGVELGGCPLASAVALTSFGRGAPVDAVYVRKEVKDHGSRRLLEGCGRLPPGARIALVEDVVTTGGSTLKAVATLRKARYEVVGVAALVDRCEGGRQAIENEGIGLVAIFDRGDFLPGPAS